MEPDNQQNQIDRFLRKELQGKELEDFMQELKENKAFLQEVELQKTIAKGIEHRGNQELRQRLRKITQEETPPKSFDQNNGRFHGVRFLLAAAAVITLLIFGWNFWNSSNQRTTLFSEFYEPYSISLNTRSTEAAPSQAEAEQAYRNGDFKDAIVLLEKLNTQQPDDANLLLALGNSYLQADEYQKAEKQFQLVLENENTLYHDQGNWFLALTYLKCKKIKESKTILQKLANENGADFQEEAKRLLEKME